MKILNKNKVYVLTLFSIVVFLSSLFLNSSNTEGSSYSNGTKMPLEVHFIDVGQGDSILIKFNGEAMLIDAGEKKESQKVINFLKSKNVTRLKYVVATHPHSDHIGAMSDVLYAFEVENVIMPKVTSTSKTFENLVTAITDKNINVITPIKGDKYTLGDSTFTILSPLRDEYEDLNDYSVVIRLLYGKSSFLFTGDAEILVEDDIMDNFTNLSSTVLKVPHHGSNSSSSSKFLETINPQISVISVGKNNTYDHPKKDVLKRVTEKSDYIYRTDENGDISLYTDGQTIDISMER